MQGIPDHPQSDLSIVILGAGSIGVAFAATFSQAGIPVVIVEPDVNRRHDVPTTLSTHNSAIAEAGLDTGMCAPLAIADTADMHLASAPLVLECGPENLDIKQAIFADLLQKTGDGTVLATASSAMTISTIVPDHALQRRCLVAHPVNPPSVLRVIELVPAPGTEHTTTAAAARLFGQAGFHPVALDHEIEGFVLNRLQSAVLREAYRLVDEDVCDVEGIDTIMRLGLGPRWALSGPFETAELNTPGGIKAHAARMGPAYKRIGEGRGETVDWRADLVDQVSTERRALIPEADLPSKALWRARAVAQLVAKRDALMRDGDGDGDGDGGDD